MDSCASGLFEGDPLETSVGAWGGGMGKEWKPMNDTLSVSVCCGQLSHTRERWGNTEDASGLSQWRGEEPGDSCTPRVSVIGGTMPPKALILRHSEHTLHKCRVRIQCFEQDLKVSSGGSLVGGDKCRVDTRRPPTTSAENV